MTEDYKKKKQLKKQQLLVIKTKLISVFVLSVMIFVFIFSMTYGAFSQENDTESEIKNGTNIKNNTETAASTVSEDKNEDNLLNTNTTISTLSKTPEQKQAELENGYIFEEYNKNCDWPMLIVNPNNPVPENYTVNTTKYEDFDVDIRMVNQLKAMIEAARNDGLDLWLSSAYRSNEVQKYLFEQEASYYTDMGYSEVQAKELAKKSVAVPGTSEHEMGLAVDFNDVNEDFKYTPEYAWLSDHAAEYGFIQRYAEEKQAITNIIFEPWHYRYVGKENAMKIKASGYCLEEYVYNLINQ